MWRGFSMNFSMKTRSSPKELAASDLERAKAVAHLVVGPGDAHALAAAAGGRLDHHRIADLLGNLHRLVRRADDAEIAGHGGNARLGSNLLGLDLVPHRLDGIGMGADEDDAGRLQHLRKARPLRQKAVTGMNGLGACLLAGGKDLVGNEIGVRGRRRADMDGLVGHLHVQGVLVRLGMDGDRLDAHRPAGLDDPAGDLAAIGNQDLVEHGRSIPFFKVIGCHAF